MALKVGDDVQVTVRLRVEHGPISSVRASYVLRGNTPIPDPTHYPRRTYFVLDGAGQSGDSYTFRGKVPSAIFGGTYGVNLGYSYPSPTSPSGGFNEVGLGLLDGHDLEIDDDPTSKIPPQPIVTVIE